MRALEINNLSTLVNRVFGFITDMRATIMLQTMRDFIIKNSYFSLNIICAVAINI